MDAYVDRMRDTYLHDVIEFLKIPSISALSIHEKDVLRAARWVGDYAESIGLERVDVVRTEGHPVVVGEWMKHPNRPTVLIYGHYDVQPVDPLDLWTSPPFEPRIENGNIYARGAADDKGQVMAVLQAIEALLASEGTLPVNVKILIEGEEEIGSPSLERFIRTYPERVQSDVIMIADTSMVADGRPTICYGLRGICALELHVKTANTDLHSGLYGGAVPNALHVTTELLARLRDAEGNVLVPGFYDEVTPLGNEEREMLADLPFDEEKTKERLGLEAFVGEKQYSPFERMSVRPTLEVNGLWGGFQGEGTKTVIPNEARVKITCRLVPNQHPDKIARQIIEYVKSQADGVATVTAIVDAGARSWRCDPTSRPVQAAARALEKTFQTPTALARMGGSIPVVEVFDRLVGVPCVLMGFAAPDCNAHAPNEYFSTHTLHLARRAVVEFFRELTKT